MSSQRKPGLLERLIRLIDPGLLAPPEIQQARELLAAIDAGGVPLNPMRVNHIARSLGLEVSRTAPMAETIERIRAAVARHRAT